MFEGEEGGKGGVPGREAEEGTPEQIKALKEESRMWVTGSAEFENERLC